MFWTPEIDFRPLWPEYGQLVGWLLILSRFDIVHSKHITVSRDNSAEGTVRKGTFYLDKSLVSN